MATLLVVEDDDTIGQALRAGLAGQGHMVTWVRCAKAAMAAAGQKSFDLVLLDLGLPDRDGVELCRDLRRQRAECVIVILTARDEEIDVVVGLEAGADDYLTKPFRLAELYARVRAHLRRGAASSMSALVAEVGALRVDRTARRVSLAGAEVELRAKEFDLLARLAADVGVVISRETLMDDVWDENWFGSTKTLDVHISALRAKLSSAAERAGSPAPEITTIRGRGYRLDPAS